MNWALARQNGWRIVLRMDDLDGPRVRAGADRDAIEILEWLGIDWDEGPVYESDFIGEYHRHLVRLAREGVIYPCACTRSQIAAASLSAPHGDEHELRYPGTCRPTQPIPVDLDSAMREGVAWRLRVPDETVGFTDQISGPQLWNVQQHVGDFLVANKQGVASYQLAVVVDDGLAGVNEVVRGDDLLSSTPRQILLGHLLGMPQCRYWHVPIVTGPDGQRLAKRHGGWTVAAYRDAGVRADRLRGLIAHWCGCEQIRYHTAREFLENFDLAKMPKERVVFNENSHWWLLGKQPPPALHSGQGQ